MRAALVGAVTATAVAAALLAPSAAEDDLAARAAAIAGEFEARDAATLATLTDHIDAARGPVAAALSRLHALDADDEAASVGAAARETLAELVSTLADRPSAGTMINLAHESFDLALAQALASAELAAAAAPIGDVRESAALAVRTWSIGASLLDLAHIEARNGHHHAYLPLQVPGALTADG